MDVAASLRPRIDHRHRSMSARSRLLTKDEELGKRDDDFKPHLSRASSMNSLLPWKWRKRRQLIVVLIIAGAYLLLHQIPLAFQAFNEAVEAIQIQDPYAAVAYSQPTGPPPRDPNAVVDATPEHYYNGVVRFYKLAKSLHAIPRNVVANKNVLFVASSTRSAANLIPMACEMARVDRNHAHFALFGRSTLPLDDILMLNGVDNDECKVHFHDARADFPEYSSVSRAEAATKGAMKHINDFMHPQAIIMDDGDKEEASFTTAMRQRAKDVDRPLIEIPSGRYEEWLWVAKLDVDSIANWFKPNIEIVIHAPAGSSGRLIRLLQSLYNADYRGFKVPRITIELPSDVEHFLQKYLSGFRWPPKNDPMQSDSLTLRHRIPSSRTSSEEASIRFVESFYPSNSENNHVLVLSSQAEVSPRYLQYLYYHILEYRYQAYGWSMANDLLGISLDRPTTLLSGQGEFTPPAVANTSYDYRATKRKAGASDPSPFLYQAASSTATLIFGDKWVTFHDFLSKRVQASHSGKKGKTKKIVSETEPAWVEFLVELMRARSWRVFHPANSFVTLHNELAQLPEEFARPPSTDSKLTEIFKQADHSEEEPYILSADPPVLIEHVETDTTRDQMPLHKMLPFDGELQDITGLPIISHEGSVINSWDLSAKGNDYVTWFRAAIGGCQGAQASRGRVVKNLKTDDLFCLPGVEMNFEDEAELERDWAEHVAAAIVDSTNDALKVSTKTPTTVSGVKPTKRVATVKTTTETKDAAVKGGVA